MKKEWYNINLECIKRSKYQTFEEGEKVVLAKVRSQGLAYIIVKTLHTIYDKKYYKITVC